MLSRHLFASRRQYIRLDKTRPALHTSAAMILAAIQPHDVTVLLLFAAMVGIYIGGRLAISALAPPDGSKPGARAIAQWIPILCTVVAAIIMRQPQAAMSIIFGTSVACLSLALGATAILAPLAETSPIRRVWAFVLPVALICFVAGFNGSLVWWHALLLLVVGAGILSVWTESPASLETGQTQVSAVPLPGDPTQPFSRGSLAAPNWLLVIVSVIIVVAAAWLMMVKAPEAAANARWLSPGLLASFILSPLIVLPTFVTITAVGQQGHSGRAMTALVGTVLLNLCLLLPLAILIQHFIPAPGATADASHALWTRLMVDGQPLPYPIAVWRIDSVLLVMLGFLLVPVALGRWVIGQITSLALIFGYIVYLAAEIYYALRTHLS